MKEPLLRFLKDKRIKWGGLAVLVFLALSFAFGIFFFQPWLRNKLQTEVKEKSGGLYSLQLGNLRASLLTGTLTIDSLALLPDSLTWRKLQQANQPDLTSSLASLQARRLKVTGVNYLGLAFNKPPDLGSITLHEPVLHVIKMRVDTTASELPHQSGSGLAGLKVKKIRVENGTFTYQKDRRHQHNAAEAAGLDLEIRNLLVDSAAYYAEDRIFYAKEFEFSAASTNLLMPQGNGRLKTGKVKAGSGTNNMHLKQVSFTPVFSPAGLARYKGEASTWMDLKIPEVTLTAIDFNSLAKHGDVFIGEVNLAGPQLKAFKDKQNFRARSERPLPHHLVQQFKTRLAINKITVSNMQVRYDELAEKAKTTGHMGIRNLDATITNVTNNPKRISAKEPAIARVGFNLVGQGRLDCTIRMALLDPGCFHTISGNVSKTDLTSFNSILEPAYYAGFKSGYIQHGTFNLRLHCNQATGTMKLNYSDLELELLSKDEERKQSLPKKVLSKIANKVVVKEDNQPEKDGLRTAEIKVSRQKKRSVFTYWKDCLEQGLLVSAGIEKFAPTD